MGFQCGLVGLPNAGKTTVFNALTAGHAPVGPFPFTTIDANLGVAAVPDPRLAALARLLSPEKATPTTLRFVDIAGLVKGASKGQGLGNQFLGKIREVDAIAEVVRVFADPNVAHPLGDLDPVRDMEIVETELALADLEWLQKRREAVVHKARSGEKDAQGETVFLEMLAEKVGRGDWLADVSRGIEKGSPEEGLLRSYPLLTVIPILYLLNTGGRIADIGPAVESAEDRLRSRGARWVRIDAKFEEELADLPADEAAEFLAAVGRSETAVAEVVREGYTLLGLITFYTTVGVELRAWTVPAGTTVSKAAGKIHSDMEHGFIKAEVVGYDDLMHSGSLDAVKGSGHLRVEGHDYVVRDGDIIRIRFKA